MAEGFIDFNDLIQIPWAKTIIVARHESAELDMSDRNQAFGYIRGVNDPSLSEKGKESAKETRRKLPDGIKAIWSSPLKRAYKTAKIYADDKIQVVISQNLTIADYGGVPDSAIDEYLKTQNDAQMYSLWAKTTAFDKTIERVKRTIRILLQGNNRVVCVVAHDEICRLILCLCQGVDLKNFADDRFRVKRGEFVVLNKSPKEVGFFKRS